MTQTFFFHDSLGQSEVPEQCDSARQPLSLHDRLVFNSSFGATYNNRESKLLHLGVQA